MACLHEPEPSYCISYHRYSLWNCPIVSPLLLPLQLQYLVYGGSSSVGASCHAVTAVTLTAKERTDAH
jgi:hypothetical protein